MTIDLRLAARALFPVLVLACLAGCSTPRMIRTQAEAVIGCNPQHDNGKLSAEALARCAATFEERATELSAAPRYAYRLYFVELDDQGWEYLDEGAVSRQMDKVLDRLRGQLQDPSTSSECVGDSRQVNLLVYVHGWKHGADAEDGNVENFRRLLRDVAVAECGGVANAGQQRAVIGIYVGWRGSPNAIKGPLQQLTFWNRKGVAAEVAQGGIRELIARLDALADMANGNHKDPRTKPVRMMFIGHSFGGHILLTGLGGTVVQNLAAFDEAVRRDRRTGTARPSPPSLSRSGDMIVLINPALEATRFEALHSIARKWQHDGYRAPIFVSVTSAGDVATSKAFPIARLLLPLANRYTSGEQARADRHTFGHDPRYITHQLMTVREFNESEFKAKPVYPTLVTGCAAWSENSLAAIQAEFLNHRNFTTSLGPNWSPAYVRPFCAGTVLIPVATQLSGTAPILNIRASPELIKDHSAIYDPRFVSFIRELYMGTLEPDLALSAEPSRGADRK